MARPSRIVAGAAVLGGAALPIWRVGTGWTLVGLAVFGVAVAHFAGGFVKQPWRVAAGLAALVLLGFAGVRAAPWLVAICLLAALALGSYALAGHFIALPLAIVPGIRWLRGDRETATDGPVRLLVGLAAGVALVIVFGSLFVAADPTFAKLLRGWLAGIPGTEVVRAVLGAAVVAGLAAGAAYLASTHAPVVEVAVPASPAPAGARRLLGLAEWLVPLAMLDVLFGTFVWVQFTTLFAGEEVVLTPGGPDYADYARNGFLQLVVVTILALGVIAVAGARAGRQTRRERVLLRVLGGLLCGLTLVVVASALKRMALYVGAYGFTGERLLGNAFEVWLGLVIQATERFDALRVERWRTEAAS